MMTVIGKRSMLRSVNVCLRVDYSNLLFKFENNFHFSSLLNVAKFLCKRSHSITASVPPYSRPSWFGFPIERRNGNILIFI